MGNINTALFQWIYGLSHRNVFIDGVGIFFAQYFPYFLIIGFLVLVFYKKGIRQKLYLFCEGVLAVILARGIVTEVIRFFYHHPRPFDALGFTPLIAESGWSFPSGHATFYFALSMTVWFVNRKWGMWYLLAATVMGIARIYVGVHWPLDVLGGALIGIASGVFVHWFLKGPREALV